MLSDYDIQFGSTLDLFIRSSGGIVINVKLNKVDYIESKVDYSDTIENVKSAIQANEVSHLINKYWKDTTGWIYIR